MIAFGSAVTDPEIYGRCAEPGIHRASEPDSVILAPVGDASIFRNYNVMLDEAAKRDAVMAAVHAAFKPEFLNRLDDVVLFDPLSLDELSRIVEIQVKALADRLTDRRLTLDVTPAAREWLAIEGFDPAYGARPLRRLVQREIGDRLARMLLGGEVRDGDTVQVDRSDDGAAGLTLAVVARPVASVA